MPKVGYVAIVGRPNAGKSTLLNALIGEKVSAVSYRPQTTQRSIPGIFTDEGNTVQIVFLDTPGIHNTTSDGQFGSQKSFEINERINSEAFASLREADVIIRLLDPTRPYGIEDERIDEVLSFQKKPILRIETKQDMDNKSYPQKGVDLRIDSVEKIGFDELIKKVSEYLPEGPLLYDPEYYTDQPMDLRIQEVIREILFLELGDEIPYAAYVEVAEIEEREAGTIIQKPLKGNGPAKERFLSEMLRIQAYINVESDSQKTIIIGKGGKKIETIGTRSRMILEDIFDKKVFLALRVKVHKHWRKDEKTLEKLFPKK